MTLEDAWSDYTTTKHMVNIAELTCDRAVDLYVSDVLVEDMRLNGQRHPIKVLDGKIIDGLQRVQAAHILGWTQIWAV